MNLSTARSRPGVRHPALTGLALLLAPGLATDTLAARSRQREWRPPESSPYLIATGPPSLRFCAPPAPPEPELRPVAGGPPVPGLSAQEAIVATANSAAAQVALGEGAKKPEAASPAPGSTPSPVPAKPGPPAILPDDTRTQIRAEDFLPFFQVPGARPAAAPGTLPPSSATYTQTPK